MKQYGFNGSYYNEEMSSVKTLDLLPRYIYMCYSIHEPNFACCCIVLVRCADSWLRWILLCSCLQRSCRLLVHEICHLFCIDHCIFHACCMNGSGHLQEDFSKFLKRQSRMAVSVAKEAVNFCSRLVFENQRSMSVKELHALHRL